MAEGVASINSTLSSDDVTALQESLTNEFVGLEEVDFTNAPHYLTLLRATRAMKEEVCINNLILQGLILNM